MDAALPEDLWRGAVDAFYGTHAVDTEAAETEHIETRRPALPAGMSSLLVAAGVLLIALNLRIATSQVPPVLTDLPVGELGRWVLVTIPAICFSLAAFAGPPLRTWLGEERGLFVLLAILLLGTALRPFWGAWSLFAGTIVCGLAVAVMNVMMPSIVRRRFPGRLGEMTGAYTVALSIGSGLSAGLTVPLARALWGSIAWALAAWALVAAAAMVVWLPQLRWPRTKQPFSGLAFGLLKSGLAWQLTFYFGLQSMVWYTLLSWLPAIYRDRGTDAATAGAFLGVLTAFGIIGNIAAPIAASRLRDPRLVVLAASVLTVLSIVGILQAPAWTALLWIVLLAIGTASSFSLSLFLMASRHRDPARLSSIAQGFGYLIAATGPILAGFLHAATHGWTIPLVVLIGVSAFQLAMGMMAARPTVGARGT